jgi:hypothetical protein
MKKIIECLYVGDQDDAPEALNKDFTVVSMLKEGPVGHRSILKYDTLGAPNDKNYYFVIRGKHFAGNLIDTEDPDFIPEEVINPALEFIKKQYDKGEKVLVHCQHGVSRSPVTVMMFLRSIGEFPYSFNVSKKIFKTLYPKLDPAKGIEIYARRHWAELENKDYGSI